MLKADKKDTRTKSMTSGVFTANLKLLTALHILQIFLVFLLQDSKQLIICWVEPIEHDSDFVLVI